jgi:hypothetical protein
MVLSNEERLRLADIDPELSEVGIPSNMMTRTDMNSIFNRRQFPN